MDGSLRIYISKQAYSTYKENDKKLFAQYSDMFFWCVLLGYHASPDQIPPNIGSDRPGTIYWQAFEDEIQKPALKAICVKASGSFDILKPNPDTNGYEKFRDILQNYAELGFSVLNTRLSGNYSVENTDKLMEIMIEICDI